VALVGATQPIPSIFSCAPLANLTTVEVILVPLVILAGFRPSKRGREAMSGK